jgi:hypothetical protein
VLVSELAAAVDDEDDRLAGAAAELSEEEEDGEARVVQQGLLRTTFSGPRHTRLSAACVGFSVVN